MYMLRKGKKKGMTLVELMVALAIFIILCIPIGNAIMQNIKANKVADTKKEEVMAINYGYEKIRDLASELYFKTENIEEDKEYDVKDSEDEYLVYNGKFRKYIYKYKIENKSEDIEKFSTESGRTDPLKIGDKEFESELVTILLELYDKESNEQIGNGEKYTFRVNR